MAETADDSRFVEAVGRALARYRHADYGQNPRWWDAKAAEIIEAHKASLATAGYKIVPREPNKEMRMVGGDVVVDFDSYFRMPDSHAAAVWRAMWDAAP